MKSVLFAFGLTILTPQLAHTQVVGEVHCINCSELGEQITSYAKQAEQFLQELATAQNTLQFYINAVQNTASLTSSSYRNLSGDVFMLTGILRQSQLLGSDVQTMLQNQTAPGGYPVSVLSNWQQQLTVENVACANAVNQDSQVLQTQLGQLSSDASTAGLLQTEIMNTTGRQASLQSLGGALATLSQLASKLHGTALGGTNRQATCEAARNDRRALLDALNEKHYQDVQAMACQWMGEVGGSLDECGGGQ